MILSLTTVPRKSENVVFRKIADECILVPLAGSVADVRSVFCLNETGATVWEKIDGTRSLGEIVAALRAEYEVENPALQLDVTAFLADLLDSGLLVA